MAAPTSETFGYVYAITVSDSNITLSSKDATATGITVQDPNGGSVSQGDAINVSPAFGSGIGDTFIGRATVKDQGATLSGIVIEQGGNYYFLTDTQYAGNVSGSNGKGSIFDNTDTI